MSRARQMVMVVPCDTHSDAVMAALDESQVRDWVIVPSSQCRRAGHLVYVPSLREHSCDVILGMADKAAVKSALDALKRAVKGQGLCPDCLAYTWQAREVSLGDAAFDPVCEMSVNREDALSVEHDGVTYYFCCQECRDRFVNNPEAFVSK